MLQIDGNDEVQTRMIRRDWAKKGTFRQNRLALARKGTIHCEIGRFSGPNER